jgi:hypothetical protein
MTFSYELGRPSLHFVKNHPANFPWWSFPLRQRTNVTRGWRIVLGAGCSRRQLQDAHLSDGTLFWDRLLATSDGLQLTKAFMQIPNAKLRRSIVNLVEQIAGPDDQ